MSRKHVYAIDIVPPELLARRLRNGRYRYDNGTQELEKRCSKCREYWPADTEFFYAWSRDRDGLAHACKACFNAYPRPGRNGQPLRTHL